MEIIIGSFSHSYSSWPTWSLFWSITFFSLRTLVPRRKSLTVIFNHTVQWDTYIQIPKDIFNLYSNDNSKQIQVNSIQETNYNFGKCFLPHRFLPCLSYSLIFLIFLCFKAWLVNLLFYGWRRMTPGRLVWLPQRLTAPLGLSWDAKPILCLPVWLDKTCIIHI